MHFCCDEMKSLIEFNDAHLVQIESLRLKLGGTELNLM